MIPSLSTPDRYERAVAFYLNTIENVAAERPMVGTKYPDVIVDYRGVSCWMEVKMNEQDQMGCPRVRYEYGWCGKSSPLQDFTCSVLTGSEQATDFLVDLMNFTDNPEMKIPTTRGGMKDPDAVTVEQMTEFISAREDSYVCRIDDVNLGDLITQHYNFGKQEPAHYIQMGDQFFALGNQNPLGLNVPKLEGEGIFKVRVQVRSEFYEVIPEIKIRDAVYSPFSVSPGTLKPHPFNL